MIRCGLDGCMYTHIEGSTFSEHDWRDSVEGQSCSGKSPRRVTVFAVVGEQRERNEIMLSVAAGDDEEIESWLTVSDAEYLIYALGSAIRRVTTYRAPQ